MPRSICVNEIAGLYDAVATLLPVAVVLNRVAQERVERETKVARRSIVQ